MADEWQGINSSHIDSLCGEAPANPLAGALDGSQYWGHSVDEVHWFILDLGEAYTIKKVKGRSWKPYDPIDVNIYVSNDKEDWGAAVATGIDVWRNVNTWQEVDTVEKDGRYIKVEILDTEHANRYITWGWAIPFFTIFDVYGDIAPPPPNPYPTNRLSKEVISGYHCFVQAYVNALREGYDPLKLPDGTVF